LLLAALLAASGWVGGSAGAVNLVPNPAFDEPDLAGWIPADRALVEWRAVDESGSPSSGSMRVFGAASPALRVQRCIAVVGGEAYAFGASARVPAFSRIGQEVRTRVRFWSEPDCDGVVLEPGEGAVTVDLSDSWGTVEGWRVAPNDARSATFVLISTAASGSVLEVLLDNAFFVEGATCASTPSALCLSHGRFLFTAEWATRHFAAGYGRAVRLTHDSGYVEFFAGENVEIVVKLLDACSTPFERFWFFAAGLTDVGTTMRVYDTLRGGVRTYVTFLEEPFPPIQDTAAFATCP
jgi:hypothetical protein